MYTFEIKKYEVSPYDQGSCIIKNSAGTRFEIISEYQAELLEILSANQNFVSILFPPHGIATAKHLRYCFSLFQILKKLGLIQRNKESTDRTNTKDLALKKSIISFFRLDPVQPLAAFCIRFFGAPFAILPSSLILMLSLIALVTSIVFIPNRGQTIFTELNNVFFHFWLLPYISVCVSLSIRAILRSAFMVSKRRKDHAMAFTFVGPFLSLNVDGKDHWMSGYFARVQLAFVGLLAPSFLALTAFLLHFGELIPTSYAMIIGSSAYMTTLMLLFPLHYSDGAEIIDLVFSRKRLHENLSRQTLDYLSGLKFKSLKLVHFVIVGASSLWALLWSDYLFLNFNSIGTLISKELLRAPSFSERIGPLSIYFELYFLLFFPFIYILYYFLSATYKRNKEAQNKTKSITNSLNHEEKRERLKNIPLFATLSDSSRDKLLKEMEQKSFSDGEELVKQGEIGNEMFVLLEGEAAAFFTEESGKKILVGSLSKGDAFGEIGLIDDFPRTATVAAAGSCTALVLTKSNFEEYLIPEFGGKDKVKQLIRLSSFFKRHPMLSRLAPEDQAEAIQRFEYISATENEGIIDSSMRDPGFHVVYTGKLVAEETEQYEEVHLLSEDCFGYHMQGQALPDIVATAGCSMLRLNQEDFKNLIWMKLQKNLDQLL